MSELPSSWAIVKLSDLGTWRGGGTPSKANPAFWTDGTIPWVSPKDMKRPRLSTAQDLITEAAVKSSATSLIDAGSVLMVTRSGILSHSLPVAVNLVPVALNQDIKAISPSPATDAFFLWFAFKCFERGILNECRKGGTTVHSIEFPSLLEFPIPLPPLAEQRRIVAKIEELFSELDAGEESLRRARRQLGVYRQSLLKQAFEGKLTGPWRKQNPHKCSTGWHKTTVGKIGRIETGTTPPTANPKNYGEELPFFKPTDLEQGQFVKAAREHLSETGKQYARVLPPGTVLVTCIGATIGKTGLAQVTCATNQQINSISPDGDTLPVFAYYQVISPAFQAQIKSNASSTTLPILNKSKFSALCFAKCALPEQQEIVRLLDEQFTVIEQNEREIDAALKRSAALRQSILKKAFTGQLVPQDPTDEPASTLLERIRKEREATGKSVRRKNLRSGAGL
ncbi:MAG: restriction endonuclease subunit S [Luteolibacter sp.]